MEFQPGDRVYHTRKKAYATVVYPIDSGTTLIEFDDPIGITRPDCKERHAWGADNDFLKFIEAAPDETSINIENLL